MSKISQDASMQNLDRLAATPNEVKHQEKTSDVVATGKVQGTRDSVETVESGKAPTAAEIIARPPPIPTEGVEQNDGMANITADSLTRLGSLEDISVEQMAKLALALMLEADEQERTNMDDIARMREVANQSERKAADAMTEKVQKMNCIQQFFFALHLKKDLGVSLKEAIKMVKTMRRGGNAATMVAMGILHAKSVQPNERRHLSKALAKEGAEASQAECFANSNFFKNTIDPGKLEEMKKKEEQDLIELLMLATGVKALAAGGAALAPKDRASANGQSLRG